MKQEVKIFLGGGVALLEGNGTTMVGYRPSVVDPVISRLNSKRNANRFYIVKTYKDLIHEYTPEGHQEHYLRFVKQKANVALFIFDGSIGDETKNEFEFACKSYEENGHPTIFFYGINLEENDEIVKYLDSKKQYYQHFTSREELKNLIQNDLNSWNKTSWWKKIKQKKWYCIVSLVVCVIAFFTGYFAKHPDRMVKLEPTPQTMLLIAGGGSVANFIETQHKTAIPTLADYPNGYYLHLPTKSAWKMLEEEVVSLQDTRRYYPICLSATKATDEDFCNAQITKQMYLDSAIIIACNLGYDSLAIYLKEESDFFDKHPDYLRNRHISIPILKQLIEDTTLNVYSTSFESGTRDGYCKILGYENEELTEYLAGQFSENSPESSISKENRSYLLLGSQYYYMKAVEDEVIKLTVQSDYVKPMMVYFMAYRKSGDNYEIPQVTIDFLHQLNYSDLDDYIDSNRTIKIRNHEHVIYSCKDLK
ncbi:MAG: hypothetical protein KBS70_04095 [Bacteroidales bacterium]|nr:hypothetical protein [Candidatus Colicola equi]